MQETEHIYSLIIIDDEEMIRNGLSRFGNWESLGFRVAATFEDGKEALEYLKETPVDVVLTDIRMAEVSGLDLAEEIAETRPETSVVIMSGYRDFDYARRAIQSSVYDYLLKPIEMETLFQTFQSLHTRITEERAVRRIRMILPDIETFLKEKLQPGSLEKDARLKELLSEISLPGDPGGGKEKGLDEKGEYSRTIIRKTRDFVEENYGRDLSLEDAAQHVYLSPVYFCRLFKELAGVNFLAYLTSVRMEKAEALLKSRRHKIYEISRMVGYGNTKYFTRVFKKQFGLTPTEYMHREFLDE